MADNGTVTPTGSVNLAFPSSGIGGSLPLSLPSAAAPAPAAQPAFPAADQNAVLSDPIFQGLIQNLRQQAGQLQLTSTVMGPRPKAVINGQMVGEGEIVAQFRVVKIDARSAVVERDGVRLEIAMQ